MQLVYYSCAERLPANFNEPRESAAKGRMQNKPPRKQTAHARKLRKSSAKAHDEGNQISIRLEHCSGVLPRAHVARPDS